MEVAEWTPLWAGRSSTVVELSEETGHRKLLVRLVLIARQPRELVSPPQLFPRWDCGPTCSSNQTRPQPLGAPLPHSLHPIHPGSGIQRAREAQFLRGDLYRILAWVQPREDRSDAGAWIER